MKKLLFTFLFLLSCILVHAQQQTYSRVLYLPGNSAQASAMIKTLDGNYAVAGYMMSWMNTGGLAMKIDSIGNQIWVKNIGNSSERFNSIVQTQDSCFFLSGDDGINLIVEKLNNNGDTIWNRNITFPGNHIISGRASLTYDQGLLLTGQISNNSNTSNRMYIVRIDSSGNVQWANQLSVSGFFETRGTSVKQMPDSGYIIAGRVYSTASPGYYHAIFIRFTRTDSVVWVKEVWNPANTYNQGVDVAINHNSLAFLMVSNQLSSLIKTDFDFNIIWTYKYQNLYLSSQGGYWENFGCPKIYSTKDFGYAVVGTEWAGKYIETDSLGIQIEAKTLWMQACDIVQTGDSALFAIGNGPLMGVKYPTTDPQIGLLRIFPKGNNTLCDNQENLTTTTITPSISTPAFNKTNLSFTVAPYQPVVTSPTFIVDTNCVAMTGAIHENQNIKEIEIYPNPAESFVSLIFPETECATEIYVFNSLGNLIFKTGIQKYENAVSIDVRALPAGMYFVKMNNYSGKFVKQN
ncbi:MAG: T9SS type A sorting domain-containing protein [Bacteroidota bacterium]